MNDKELSSKEKVIFGCGIGTLVAGITIALISLIAPPLGAVSPSVLTLTGEFLSFVGGCLGISSYTTIKIKEIESKNKETETGN